MTGFWDRSRWGDWWHRRRVVNGVVSIHSGHDVKAAAGTPVPLLHGGTVTAVGRRWDIGHYIEIRTGTTRWETYCHIIPTAAAVVGAGVPRWSTTLMTVAGDDDDHGALWTGPHLHFMVASRPDAAAHRLTVNPQPFIEAALAAPNEEETEMLGYGYIVRPKSGKVAKAWALLHPTLIPGGVRVTSDQAVAKAWENSTPNILEPREVSAAEWDAALKSAADLAAIVPHSSTGAPSVAEIAAAVRAELGGALTAP